MPLVTRCPHTQPGLPRNGCRQLKPCPCTRSVVTPPLARSPLTPTAAAASSGRAPCTHACSVLRAFHHQSPPPPSPSPLTMKAAATLAPVPAHHEGCCRQPQQRPVDAVELRGGGAVAQPTEAQREQRRAQQPRHARAGGKDLAGTRRVCGAETQVWALIWWCMNPATSRLLSSVCPGCSVQKPHPCDCTQCVN